MTTPKKPTKAKAAKKPIEPNPTEVSAEAHTEYTVLTEPGEAEALMEANRAAQETNQPAPMTAPVSEAVAPLGELCRICHEPKSEHKRGIILHSFIGEFEQAALALSPENSAQQSPPDMRGKPQGSNQTMLTDSVLRLALLRAGVLKVSDLEVIEAELKATGIAAYDPGLVQRAEEENAIEVLPPAS